MPTRHPREFVIYTDESDKDGAYYSNFYGGALIRSPDLSAVIEHLDSCKKRLNLFNEVKWQRVTENYLGKYIELIAQFFDLVAEDRVKIRIMFTQNRHVPLGLSSEQRRLGYYLLYYQFIKNAFGLTQCPHADAGVRVRLNMDQLPSNREENARFKSFLVGLNGNPAFRRAKISFSADQVAEVRSHEHVILQCLDVVLGAMSFRLNDKHLSKPRGKRRRGKRTIAKEKLYEFILGRIRKIYPNFNIGDSTGKQGDWANIWRHPYRHWKFIPSDHAVDASKVKPKK